MESINNFRSENVLNKSDNKLHGLALCTMMMFNMIFEWLPHICTPHRIIYKVLRSSSEFYVLIQRPRRFSNDSLNRAPIGWSLNYPFEHGEVNNYTLNGVSKHPVITKIQARPLNQLPERKETAQGFHHEYNGNFNIVTEFNGGDRRKVRMDPQHCCYSTTLP